MEYSNFFNNNFSEQNGIDLSIKEPNFIAFAIPPKKPDAYTCILIKICISNYTTTPFFMIPNDQLIPELVTSSGQVLSGISLDEEEIQVQPKQHILKKWVGNFNYWLFYLTHPFMWTEFDDGYLLYRLIYPEHGAGIFPTLKLYWQDNELNLLIIKKQCFYLDFKLEKSWLFERLKPEIYQLRFKYGDFKDNNPNSDSETIALISEFVNLNLIETTETNNAAIEVNQITFETLIPESEFIVPSVSEKEKFLYNLKFFFKRPRRSPLPSIKVQIGIRITNNTLNPLRVSLYGTLIPEILGADGQIIRGNFLRLGFGRPRESDYPLVMPGESLTFFPDARVVWSRGDLFTLSMAKGNGGYENFSGLKLGSYQFRFSYQKQDFSSTRIINPWETIEREFVERIGTGRVDLPFVKFCLVES